MPARWRKPLQWRHNGPDGVSNHQRLDCLLNRLFRRKSIKTSLLRLLAFVRGIYRLPVNSPHKGQLRGKCSHLMTSSSHSRQGPFAAFPVLSLHGESLWAGYPPVVIIITRDSEVILFSPCVFVCLFVCLFVCVCLCLSRCLSGRFNYEGLVPHKQYFAGTLLGMSSCASYVSRTHDVIDEVTSSQSRSNFEIDISPSIFELEHRSKAQNVGNAHGYLSGIFNFRYNFR